MVFISTMIVLLFMLAIPYLVSTFYRIYYNRKINQQLSNGIKKKVTTPLQVFLLTISLEIIVIVIVAILGSYNPDGNVDQLVDPCTDIYTKEEISDTLYELFDGSNINGYALNTAIKEDFKLTIYENDHSIYHTMPDKAVEIQYTGKEEICYYYIEVEIENEDISTGTAISGEDISESYFIFTSNVPDCLVNYHIYLFNQNDYESYQKEVDPNDELILEKNEEYATDYLDYTLGD